MIKHKVEYGMIFGGLVIPCLLIKFFPKGNLGIFGLFITFFGILFLALATEEDVSKSKSLELSEMEIVVNEENGKTRIRFIGRKNMKQEVLLSKEEERKLMEELDK